MAIEKIKVEEEACMIRFYKIVLSWDYFRLLQLSQKSSKELKKGGDFGLKAVKNTFKDVDDYLATFESLLFEEVKAQIVQAKDEGTSVGEQKMCVVKECSDSDGFYFPTVFHNAEDGESFFQNDLLLLSQEKFEKDKLPITYAFALVEHRQLDSLRLRMFLQGEVKGIDIHHTEANMRLVNMRSRLSADKALLYMSKAGLSRKPFVLIQGREKDVAIFSCVRASKDRGIGFVVDFRRMNVGITRARSSIFVVGSASTLKRDKHWSNLIEAAVKNDSLFEVTKPYASFFSDEHLKSMEVVVETDVLDEETYGPLYGDADNPVQGMDENDYEDGGFGDGGGDD